MSAAIAYLAVFLKHRFFSCSSLAVYEREQLSGSCAVYDKPIIGSGIGPLTRGI